MSNRFKDFGSGGETSTEPLVFKLHGEEFTAIPTIQGKVLMDLVSKSQSEDSIEAMGVVSTFFDKVLVDESMTRFNVLLEDKERIVTMDTLGEIISWLIEEYSGRPNQQPEES
jgi:hypothetical protein